MPIHFYVDPATNYSDPDARMAYGLHVVSHWGGTVFINLPEHLEYMPEHAASPGITTNETSSGR